MSFSISLFGVLDGMTATWIGSLGMMQEAISSGSGSTPPAPTSNYKELAYC
ncbi:MAG: hypothetical protein ACOYL3_25415 [Desulfuromonadaceae bacterium]